MYSSKEIKREIMDWDHEDSEKTKCVRVSVDMEMLNGEQQAEIEAVYKELIEKIKDIVPENPPAPEERKGYYPFERQS